MYSKSGTLTKTKSLVEKILLDILMRLSTKCIPHSEWSRTLTKIYEIFSLKVYFEGFKSNILSNRSFFLKTLLSKNSTLSYSCFFFFSSKKNEERKSGLSNRKLINFSSFTTANLFQTKVQLHLETWLTELLRVLKKKKVIIIASLLLEGKKETSEEWERKTGKKWT